MKEKLYALLKDMLYHHDSVIAAMEGGSIATGFADQYSDLDLEVIVKDDAVEEIFNQIESLIHDQFGIIRRYRIPEPAWHGFSQCFYLIDHMPKHFYLDLAIIKASIQDKLTDPKRHGHAKIWFDKEHIHQVIVDTEEQIVSRCKSLYQRTTQMDFLMMIELEKNLDRDNFLESYPAYFRFIYNQLGVMLNLKYRREKVDFGLRYAYRDFPLEDVELLKNLLINKNMADLRSHYEQAKDYYLKLKSSFEDLYK